MFVRAGVAILTLSAIVAAGLGAAPATAPLAASRPGGLTSRQVAPGVTVVEVGATSSSPASRLVETGRHVRTEHYDLYVEGLDTDECGRLLEALHAQLAAHFGSAPKGRLAVCVYETKLRWQQALAQDRQPVPATGGGYYSPGTRKAYLFIQPSDYFTRQLVLHEAAHQFHWLVATGNRALKAAWFTEGLVDHFAMHDWDGRVLRCGIVPAITLEDYPAAALRQLDEAGPLEDVVSGKYPSPRPLAWALVSFLMEHDSQAYRRLQDRLNDHAAPLEAWGAVYGDKAPTAADLTKWLAAHQQPWKIVWISWQQQGKWLSAESTTNALALLKQPADSLQATVEPVAGPLKAGLVFGWKDDRNFWLLQATDRGGWRIVQRIDGAWKIVKQSPGGRSPPATATSGPAQRRLALRHVAGGMVLSVDGADVMTVNIPAGAVGLNADGCAARFDVVAGPPN